MGTSAKPDRLFQVIVFTGVACVALAASAGADCGSIPFSAVLRAPGSISIGIGDLLSAKPDVTLDPLNVVVYEPGQRAIILWNGEEEILLLSTEIRTSQAVSILEVIPLPAEPEVTLGTFETFEKMQRLLVEKTMWKVASGAGYAGIQAPKNAARITFHEQMGAHDIAVVEVLDKDHFVDWVKDFLTHKGADNPQVRPDFLRIIQNYLERDLNWFVFDTIQATDKVGSRQPIQYRFKTDFLYYPLEISSLETGRTNIDLLLVTGQKLSSYPVVRASMKRHDSFSVGLDELRAISPDWASFMGTPSVTLQQVRIKGNLRKMKTDFVAR